MVLVEQDSIKENSISKLGPLKLNINKRMFLKLFKMRVNFLQMEV